MLPSYALAQCFAKAYSNTNAASDPNATAAGYLEFGNIDADAYAEAMKIAEKRCKMNTEEKRRAFACNVST